MSSLAQISSPPEPNLDLNPPHRIVVMGVSGAGKTTLGQALAQAMGILFRDGDDLHSRANIEKMRAGIALQDQDRWLWLELIANSLRRDAPVVIACSALKAAYRDHIRAGAGGPVQFVYLSGSFDEAAARLAARKHPFMNPNLLQSQFDDLATPLPDEAITVPFTLSVRAQVAAVLAALPSR